MIENIYDPSFVKDLFNRMSTSYERMNYITSFGFSHRWRSQFINRLPARMEKTEVLDLLCGMGETWSFIKKRFPDSNLTALDFSIEMIKKAEHKNTWYFDKKVDIIQADILTDKIPGEKYDIVYCAFGLKTFSPEQLSILAKETFRLLKKGGQFSFVEVSKPENSILQMLYKLHIGTVVPFFGKLLLGNPEEYRMLWRYTERFQNTKSVIDIFQKTGLSIEFDSYFFGCATGFHGRKIN